MDVGGNSYAEEFLEKQRPRAQKIFYPINLSFAYIDSSDLPSSKHRFVKLSNFMENMIGIKMNSPEDNLKPYKHPLWICHLILAASFLISSFLPFYFMAATSAAPVTLEYVMYWIFWVTFLLTLAFFLMGWRKLEHDRHSKRSRDLLQQFSLRRDHWRMILVESAILFSYVAIFFYASDHIENLLICQVQIIAIVFRFCFRIGRSISLNNSILYGFGVLILGMVVSVVYFNILKEDYRPIKGFLSIAAAFLGGIFWLRNREGNFELNLTYKLFLINSGMLVMSFVFSVVFFSVANLFSFLLANFFLVLGFTLLLLAAFYLKKKVVEVYEDLIPTLLYVMEPLCLYLWWELFLRMGTVLSEGSTVFSELLSFFFCKFLFVLAFLISGQVLVLVEMKKNEVNLDGGKLGIKLHQRDRMKFEHLDMLMRMNIDNDKE